MVIKQLKSLQRWDLKHLKIICRGTGFTDDNQDDDELACAIISHCKPESLTSLHIFEGIDSGVYRVAANHHQGLRRLHMHTTWSTEGNILKSINDEMLNQLCQHFTDIEWLVLSNTTAIDAEPSNNPTVLSNWVSYMTAHRFIYTYTWYIETNPVEVYLGHIKI
jgi:hypothetical protein